MCLIIVNPRAVKVKQSRIDNAISINPDGAGIVFLDNGECKKSIKSSDLRGWIKSAEKDRRPYVAHVRYATEGAVSIKNLHPFDIKGDVGADHHLFHNGTVNLRGTGKNTHKSDTFLLAELLGTVPPQYWDTMLSITDSRYVIVDKKTYEVSLIGDWLEESGAYFSKRDIKPSRGKWYEPSASHFKYQDASATNYNLDMFDNEEDIYGDDEYDLSVLRGSNSLDSMREELGLLRDASECPPMRTLRDLELYVQNTEVTWDSVAKADAVGGRECDLPMQVGDIVAVYGTLKTGKSNNRCMGDSKSLGAATSKEKLVMEVRGIPYLYSAPEARGNHVEVELFQLTNEDDVLNMDTLESNGSWYCREIRDFVTKRGFKVSAWVYMIPGSADKDVDPKQVF